MSGGTFDYIQYKIKDAADEIRNRIKNNSMTVQQYWDSLSNEDRATLPMWDRPWSTAPGKLYWLADDEAQKIANAEMGVGNSSELTGNAKKKWHEIWSNAVKKIADEHNASTVGSGFKDETIAKLKEMLKTIELAEIYLNRIDWLFAGDDGEDSFLARTKEEVRKFEAREKEGTENE